MEMKDVIISITGTQQRDEEPADVIELVTDGQYGMENGEYRLTYMESELTGLEGTRTSFEVSGTQVILSREGRMNSRMIFQEGRKHSFLYETPFGSATMGVNTHRINNRLSEHGGDMEIDYVVDFDHTIIGRNNFKINVRESRKGENTWRT